MMDLERQVLGDILGKHASSADKIIEEAFMEHFGFPIKDVQDTEKFERIIVQGDPVESFRYRGETFLYWNRDLDIRFDSNKDGVRITCATQFKKV